MFLRNQVEELTEESKDKDNTIMTLSHTICEKGEANRRLSEIINTFKNQLIQDKIFEQRFNVTHIGQIKSTDYTFKFVRDKSEDGEYFLEI